MATATAPRPTGAPHLSIVVLPFADISEDRGQQYFADGINDDLTTDLSRLAGMFVIARNTAFTYKDKPIDAKQIGRELGVRYVLEGSVRRLGNQVRVNAQLVDAETGAHLWAERFDRDTSDPFAVQNEITGRIALTLNLELVGAEAARPIERPDAIDYILRGRAAFYKSPTPDSYAEAVSWFERALTVDPGSAEAKSLLASILAERALGRMTNTKAEDFARAEALVREVLAVSPRSPIAHYAYGQVLRATRRNEQCIPEYQEALAFNRSWADALAGLGWCKFWVGRSTRRSRCTSKHSASARATRRSAIGIIGSDRCICCNRAYKKRFRGWRRGGARYLLSPWLILFSARPMRSTARPNAASRNSPKPIG
jgi:adenylate cyclase